MRISDWSSDVCSSDLIETTPMTALPFSHHFIVFDVDGTLIDSQHTVVHCMSAAFVAHGLPAPAAAAIRATIGLKLDIAMASLLPEPERSRALHLVEAYRTALFALQPTPEPHGP